MLSLNLTMLYHCTGSIAVTFNSALQAFSVPFFSHNSLNLNISFNPVLTEVDFPRMLYFSGAITVSQNPELAVLHFDAFGYSGENSVLTIDSNASLNTVSFLGLDCGFISNIIISNNPNLAFLRVTSACQDLTVITLVNNPNVQLVLV